MFRNVKKIFHTGEGKIVYLYTSHYYNSLVNFPCLFVWYEMKTFLIDPALLRNHFFNHVRSLLFRTG